MFLDDEYLDMKRFGCDANNIFISNGMRLLDIPILHAILSSINPNALPTMEKYGNSFAVSFEQSLLNKQVVFLELQFFIHFVNCNKTKMAITTAVTGYIKYLKQKK